MFVNTILVVFFISIIQPLNAKGLIEIELGGPNDKCAKYTRLGNDYLAITHFRVLESVDYVKGEVDKSTRTDSGYFFIIGVTAKKQMLYGPIDYRYNENIWKLIQNGFLDPEKLKKQKFNHEQHIHIKRMTVNGVMPEDDDIDMSDCHFLFPNRLIADQGLYMLDEVQRGTGQPFMMKMYYEPYLTEGRMEIGRTNHWQDIQN
ncbi:hypothetical protein CAEBREN_16284 [Caenorhabditis brenneri]|uniref:Uncharacterized protein n=1 Tax=Caenorhabditis brenneri TaxID=135651 RepID=G0P651_CAEBE|nr:hypothetical protein CAEBREN_16284 [Caenorhabditis brenneri]